MTYEEASKRLDMLIKSATRYHGLDNVDCALINISADDIEALRVAVNLLDDCCRWIIGLED